jgi:hypothetical protein
MGVFLLPLVGGLVFYFLIKIVVLSKGRSLRSRFRGLGTIKGRTRNQIVQAVGRPNTISSLPNGKTAVQWIAPGYHIVLRFVDGGDNSVCEGVTHEHSS